MQVRGNHDICQLVHDGGHLFQHDVQVLCIIIKINSMIRGNFSTHFIRILLVSCLFIVTNHSADAQSKPWVAPATATDSKNPIAGDANSVKTGKALYTTYCTPCHGEKGKGDGIASAGLNPKPANHTSAVIQSESDGSLFYKISEGRNAMPQYKIALTETQRWSLVNYIRTLAKK